MINIFETSFEARERRFQIEKLYHGETVDLVGVVTTNGVPQNITGYAVSGVFQPTSAQGSDDFYDLSADIVDNKVVVHWEKGKDFGENSYMVWALLTDGENASYPIVWRLDMAYSPNFPLSALDPIPKTIDFDKYDLLNAPWLELSAFDEFVDGLSNEYLPLSGGVVSGDFEVKDFLKGANRSLVIGKNNVQQYSDRGVALGTNLSTNVAAVSIGDNTRAGNSSIAIGQSSEAGDGSGIVIGNNSKTYSNSIAIGTQTSANYSQSIAIGNEASTTKTYEVRLGGPYQSQFGQPSLYVHDIPILSGSDHRIPKERLPYLSEYATKEEIPEVPTDLSAFTNSPGYLTAHQSLEDYETKADAATEHQTLSTDLTAYVEERISEIPVPEPPTFSNLTLQSNGSTVATYNPTSSQNLSANFAIPTKVTDLTDDLGIATQSDLNGLSATYETKQHATDTYQTKSDAVADLAIVNGKINDVATDLNTNYLPLSGGNLSGRIYLNTTETRIVGSSAVLTASDYSTINVGSWDEDVELTANVTLSVMNAGQDFIDMISNSEEYTGEELTSYTVNAKIQLVGPNGLNKTLNGSTTIGFGYYYVSDNSISFDDSLDADLGHEDQSSLVFNELVFNMGSGGDNPVFVLYFNVDGDPYDFSEEFLNDPSAWTVDTVSEEVAVVEPFVLSSEIPEVSAFATKAELNTKANESDLTALAFDVEDNYCTNQYASKTFATKGEMSACLSSEEFTAESYLPTNAFGELDTNAVSLEDLGNKINKILQLLKRDSSGPSGGDPTKTYVKYNDGTISAFNSGTSIRDGGGIPNKENVAAVKIGNTVEYLDYRAFNGFTNMESLIIPDSCIRIGAQRVLDNWYDATSAISNCSKLQTLRIPSTVIRIGQNALGNSAKTIIFEGKTIADVQSMDTHSEYPWGAGVKHAQFVCTDGTITL